MQTKQTLKERRDENATALNIQVLDETDVTRRFCNLVHTYKENSPIKFELTTISQFFVCHIVSLPFFQIQQGDQGRQYFQPSLYAPWYDAIVYM